MNLKTYLAANNLTLTEFARSLDVQAAHLSRAVRGLNPLGRRLAADIFKATQGMVDIPGRKPKEALTEKK